MQVRIKNSGENYSELILDMSEKECNYLDKLFTDLNNNRKAWAPYITIEEI